MKRFQALVIVLLLGMCGGLVYNAVNIEWRALQWQKKCEEVDTYGELNRQILLAQMYSRDVLEACKMLANENGILCEREVKMVQYVTSIEDENARLKTALKESVVNLEQQIEEINRLHEELSRMRFQLQAYEAALKLVPTPADPATKAKYDLQDIFDVLATIDAVTRVIPLLVF